MSEAKGELRLAVMGEVGNKVEDMTEQAEAEAYRTEGASSALQRARNTVEGLQKQVDAELTAEALTVEQAQLVKRWLTKAVLAVEGLHLSATQVAAQARGKAEFGRQIVGNLKKLFTLEQSRLEAQRERRAAQGELAEEGDRHPGLSLKEQRQREGQEVTNGNNA